MHSALTKEELKVQKKKKKTKSKSWGWEKLEGGVIK